ncbi:hypothetical protein GS876_10380 [Rhodococcus hoagii]|nr:hypothetical protein [Prescottella equi]NKT31590.1 hypothetical protein [Prescottella equi]NKT39258.1 hypothetical protein [Prescottella equi]NKT72924.1 hypothetical protein [Prescottella equi]NKT75886.1 hypothetical protein [Prescottella equi]
MADTRIARPVTEAGYVNGDGTDWQQWDANEKVPELQWPESVNVYSRMAREDGRVASLLQAIGLPIRRTAWRIEPNGARDEVVEFVARDLGLQIAGADGALSLPRTKGRFSWKGHLQQVLLMLQYGHSFFEQVYRIDDSDRAHLRKLAPRPQKTISKITVALDGGLESITQAPPARPLTVASMLPDGFTIPVNRLVAYVRDPEAGQWQGSSILRPAYKHWILKDEFMRIQAGAARRNGMGVPVGTASKPDDQDEVNHMHDLASRFRGGMNSGVGLALGQKLELLGVQGNLPDIQQAIDYQDKQIALAGLAHFLNLDRGGSYALASVQADTFVQSVQTFAETIADISTAHIVEDLVDVNWGEDEPAPRIVFDEIGSRQDATAAALSMLVNAGLLDADDVVKITVRQSLGIPGRPESDTAAGNPDGSTEGDGS